MLEAWLIDQNVNAALGGANAEVTAVAPDTIDLTGPNAGPRLNLFLHQVSPNAGWRNVDLPSRDARGRRTATPPLALDLHYLLTAYGPQPLQAEVLLGYGMQLLHEVPALDRGEIEARLPPSLERCLLSGQVEMLKITPTVMNTEELSKLWSAMQSHYRPTAAYHVSVVLIESTGTGRAALPVLSRGSVDPVTLQERGIVAQADLLPALPGITAVRPPLSQPGAVPGDTVIVEGHHLDGTSRGVRLENRALGVDRQIAAVAGSESSLVRFVVPDLPSDLPVGTYALRAAVQRPGETTGRESNRLSLTLLPEITTPLPLNAARDDDGVATVDLECRPAVRAQQRASLIVGAREVLADAHAEATESLTFRIADAPIGTHLVRLRVDGFDSLLVDRTQSPPVFLDRRIAIT
jgi:hypothetical protein